MGLIIGQGSKGGGGDVRLEGNHSAALTTNGTHVVTPNEGYDGMRKATINVDVDAADPADKALVNNATQYGLSHNLYKVMEEVKADPRTSGYAAIMLCQYYKGYNSLSLEGGADAFLTSDGDFYQGNAVHYWHDSNDTMFDRWVAMLFSSTSGSYTCSNASICPRAALIDGTMGKINLNASNMRFAWIDATDGSSWGGIYQSSRTNTTLWNRQAVICGIGTIDSTFTFQKTMNLANASNAIVGVKKTNGIICLDSSNTLVSLKFDGLTESSGVNSALHYGASGGSSALQIIIADDLVSCFRLFTLSGDSYPIAANLRYLSLPQCTNLQYFATAPTTSPSPTPSTASSWASLVHVEFGQGFNSSLNLRMCTFSNCLLTDTNDLVEDVVAHPMWSNLDQWLYNFEHLIVEKLADLSGQTAKTITLASAPYAAITSEIRQKMSAKNWNLASA